jgi:hypothetical protein
MEGDMRRQTEQGIQDMVDLIETEREACADMERLVQEGQGPAPNPNPDTPTPWASGPPVVAQGR